MLTVKHSTRKEICYVFNSYFNNLVISFIKWFHIKQDHYTRKAITLCENIVKSQDLQQFFRQSLPYTLY